MTARLWLLLAAIDGLLAVALGAFGAHALRERLTPDQLSIYRTAVDYQFHHALALLAVGVLASTRPSPWLNAAGLCFALGIVLFSGSLYGLALTGLRAFGPITPIGGLLFLAGWTLLAVWAWRSAG